MLRLSPTKLQAWYEAGCPAKWDFDRKWESRIPNIFAETGTAVHALMDGSVRPSDDTDETVMQFYNKLRGMLDTYGITVMFTEVKLEWQIFNDLLLEEPIIWAEKVDAIGTLTDGAPVIIDYKTNWGRGWKQHTDGRYPQSLIFQSSGYMMVPPKEVWNKTAWPKSLIYMVSPRYGQPQVIRYDYNEKDQENLIDAIDGAALSMAHFHNIDNWPKVRGKHCMDCPFIEPCYGNEKWEVNFKAR